LDSHWRKNLKKKEIRRSQGKGRKRDDILLCAFLGVSIHKSRGGEESLKAQSCSGNTPRVQKSPVQGIGGSLTGKIAGRGSTLRIKTLEIKIGDGGE